MRIRTLHRLIVILALLALLAGICASSAAAFSLIANYDYLMSGGENRPTTDDFRQRYALTLGPSFAAPFRPSHAISGSFGVNLSIVTRNNGEVTRRTDQLTPYGNLSLINDIFIINLTGYQTFAREDSETFNGNSSWQSSLQSAWDEDLWPDFRLSYGETNLSTGDQLFGKPDQVNTLLNFRTTWDFLFGDIFYNYRINELEDLLSGNITSNESHYTRLNSSTNFFSNRLNLNTTQQYQVDTRTLEFGNQGNDQLVRLTGFTSSSITDPATLSDPLPGLNWNDTDVGLNDNPLLRDGDLLTPAVTVPPSERIHLAFSNNDTISSELQIDFVRIILEPLTVGSDASQLLEWDLYVRDQLFPNEWVLQQSNIQATFDDVQKQIDIPVNFAERDILLVSINPVTGVTLEITEFELIRVFSSAQSPETEFTSYKSNYGLSYRITDTLRASFSFIYEQEDSKAGDVVTYEGTETMIAGRLSWLPSKYLTSNVSYSETLEEKTGLQDLLTRNYSLRLSSTPISTLNLGFNATHNETYRADLKSNYRNNYTLSARANLYPDLKGAWSFSYAEGEQYLNDITSVSNNWNTRLELNAQLRKYLFGDFISSYSVSERDGTENDAARFNLNLIYRPSERFSLRGNFENTFANTNTYSYTTGMFLGLLKNDKTTLTLNTRHTITSSSDDPIHSFVLNWDWFLSDLITLRGGSTYRISDTKSWSVNFNLRFSL